MPLNDSLKKAVDDLELERRLEEFGKFAQKTYDGVRAQVGTLTHDNRDKVDGWVAKATSLVDERTEGKYHDKVAKFSAAVGTGLDKVAEQRPGAAGADDPSQFEEFSGPATAASAQPAPTAGATAFPAQYPTDQPES